MILSRVSVLASCRRGAPIVDLLLFDRLPGDKIADYGQRQAGEILCIRAALASCPIVVMAIFWRAHFAGDLIPKGRLLLV